MKSMTHYTPLADSLQGNNLAGEGRTALIRPFHGTWTNAEPVGDGDRGLNRRRSFLQVGVKRRNRLRWAQLLRALPPGFDYLAPGCRARQVEIVDNGPRLV